jgi:creatinine amidohydrolase/Fe(II)-dependent formamide hydrolase-like protein
MADGERATQRDRIVHLDRLTSREVGDWMKQHDAIIVPHGPISGHGPWTTLGMHPHGAEAVAVLLARKCNALVFPTLHTCFAGATRLYPGTVPFSYEYHIQTLKHVAHTLHGQGFGRIFLLALTNPEDLAGAVAARDLFDIDGELPVAALHATRGMESPAVRKLIDDSGLDVGEAVMDYAAMRVLGLERPIAEPELALRGLPSGHDRDEATRDACVTMGVRGTRGFRYETERQHSAHGTVGHTWQGRPDIELGVAILDALADWLLPAVDALKQHRDWLKAHPPQRIEKQAILPP